MNPSVLSAVLSAALIFGASTASWGQTTYRWVDEGGQVHYSDQPPPSAIGRMEEKRFTPGTSAPEMSYTLRKLTTDFPVTLYTAPNCGEHCDSARKLLKARGIPHEEVTLASQDDLARYRERFGTPEQVPTLSVGTSRFKGFQASAWDRLLDDVGYPRTALPTPAP